MKKVNIRNIIIVLLCITIIFLAIGFVVISVKYDTLKNKKESLKVVFDTIEEDVIVKGGTKVPFCTNNIIDEGYSVDFKCTMYNEIDEVSYNVKVVNKGTLPAKIVDLIKTPDYISNIDSRNSIKPIQITTTDISGKVLVPKEETIIKVVAIYNKGNTNKQLSFPYKLTLVTTSN